MRPLILGSILARKANFLGSLVAVVLFAALTLGTVNLIYSVSVSPIETDRLQGASLMMRTDSTGEFEGEPVERSVLDGLVDPSIDASLLDRVEVLPGVGAALPELSFYAQVLDSNGQVVDPGDDIAPYGQPWSSAALTPFTLVEGAAPQRDNEIVIDRELANRAGLAVGDQVEVTSRELPTTYIVTGIASPPEGDSLPDQSTIFFSQERAEELGRGNDKLDAIGIVAEPGVDPETLADTIDATLNDDRIEYLTGSDIAKVDPTTDSLVLSDMAALLGTMSGFTGFVSIFMLSGTFAFSILQRQREIGLQRAIGVTPRQVRLIVAGEALVLALAGTLIGIVPGIAIADAIARFSIEKGVAPEGFDVRFPWWSLPVTAGTAIAISQLAAFGAGRRASKIRPIEALRESSAPRKVIGFWRVLFGLAFLGGGIAAMGLSRSVGMEASVPLAFLESILFLLAATTFGPLLAIPFSSIVGRIAARITHAPGDLARWSSRNATNRVSSVASPLVLAIGFALLMFLFTATMQTATIDQTRERTTADLVGLPTNEGLPIAIADQIRGSEGVESSSVVVPTQAIRLKSVDGTVESEGLESVAIDPAAIGDVMNLEFIEGGSETFDDTSVILSETAADFFNASAGEQITITLDDGTNATFRVAGVVSNTLGLGEVVFPLTVAANHGAQPLADSVYLNTAPGEDIEALQEQLSKEHPTIAFMTQPDYVDTVEQSAIDGQWALYLIIGLAVTFAALSVINTMVMAISERRREFALLRLVGATERQIRTMILGEASIVLAIGVIAGGASALLSMISVSQALVGDTSALTIPPLLTIATILVAAAIALTAHLLPTTSALRLNPVEQIGLRE